MQKGELLGFVHKDFQTRFSRDLQRSANAERKRETSC